jgi:hypothetical protein
MPMDLYVVTMKVQVHVVDDLIFRSQYKYLYRQRGDQKTNANTKHWNPFSKESVEYCMTYLEPMQ